MAFNCSPRKDGNTAVLLNAALAEQRFLEDRSWSACLEYKPGTRRYIWTTRRRV